MPALKPGLAFCLVTDRGFAVGLFTHQVDRIGYLIWIAEPIYEEFPTLEQVRAIQRWRWPVFFPLGAALRRKIVDRIGVADVPPELSKFPVMRSDGYVDGWRAVTYKDSNEKMLGKAKSSSLPIWQSVNDTALKEMIVSDWRPEQEW